MSTLTKKQSILMIAENCKAKITEQSLFLWSAMLAEYDDITVAKATINLIKHLERNQVPYGEMPMFSAMQKELDATLGAIDGKANIALQAESEWLKYPYYLADYIRGRKYQKNATTELVIQAMGGWEAVRYWEEKYLSLKKKEFCDLWATYYGNEAYIEAGAETIARLASSQGRQALEASTPQQQEIKQAIQQAIK